MRSSYGSERLSSCNHPSILARAEYTQRAAPPGWGRRCVRFSHHDPLSLLGLFWLAVSTDWELLRQAWPAFFLFVGLIIIFNQVRYFLIIEVRTDRYGSAEGSLSGMIQWSAVLIYGPSFL